MNNPNPLRHYILAAVLLASWAGINQASAQVLLPISGVTASSTSSVVEGSPGLTVSNNSLVAGVSTVLGASDSLGDSGFNSDDASDFGNFVFPVAGGNITYNLGAQYSVSNLLIWNFSQPGFSFVGANSVTIKSSTNGLTFSTVGTYTFDEAASAQYNSPRPIAGNNPPHPVGGTATEPAQILSLSIPDAQYIELVINSNRYDPSNPGEVSTGAGGLVGLNEVNFVGTEVVETPEPSTYAMMLAGLAVLGFCIRRKAALAK